MKKIRTFALKLILGFISLFILIAGIVLLAIPLSKNVEPTLQHLNTSQNSFLLTNVQLIDSVQNQVVPEQYILIEKGIIKQIGTRSDFQSALSDNTVMKIDGANRFVTPGLVDAHVHVFDPQDLALYLSHGITSVRNMAGLPAHLRWQQFSKQNNLAGARLITYSPALNAGNDISPFHKRVNSAEHAKSLVKMYAAQGYQGIKIYNGLTGEMLESIFAEAKKHELPVAGHPSTQIDFQSVLDSPMSSVEHIEELFQVGLNYKATKETVDDITSRIALSKKPMVSTLVAFDNLHLAAKHRHDFLASVEWDYLTSFTAFVGKQKMAPQLNGETGDWEKTKTRVHVALTKALFSKDAVVAIGSDTGPALTAPGLSFHRELELLNELHIPSHKILTAATVNSANLLQDKTLCGAIAVSCKADLLLVDSNPFENITVLKEPNAVIFDGHYLNREQLDQLREQGKQHASFYSIMGWLLEGILND